MPLRRRVKKGPFLAHYIPKRYEKSAKFKETRPKMIADRVGGGCQIFDTNSPNFDMILYVDELTRMGIEPLEPARGDIVP